MSTTKVTITIDRAVLARLNELVEQQVFPSRSRAIQDAVQEKLGRMQRGRLARECAKLDPRQEQALAEEGMGLELTSWPEY